MSVEIVLQLSLQVPEPDALYEKLSEPFIDTVASNPLSPRALACVICSDVDKSPNINTKKILDLE